MYTSEIETERKHYFDEFVCFLPNLLSVFVILASRLSKNIKNQVEMNRPVN